LVDNVVPINEWRFRIVGHSEIVAGSVPQQHRLERSGGENMDLVCGVVLPGRGLESATNRHPGNGAGWKTVISRQLHNDHPVTDSGITGQGI
jgi:hypothetical protein